MSLLVQDCSALSGQGLSRVLLCRLLRPTLGKKFFLIFAFLALTGLANWHLVDTAMSNTRGIAAVINVTGSLRWLSQRIHAESARFVHGDTRDRGPIDASLGRLDEAIHSLEYGGRAQGVEIAALPARLRLHDPRKQGHSRGQSRGLVDHRGRADARGRPPGWHNGLHANECTKRPGCGDSPCLTSRRCSGRSSASCPSR